MRRYASSAASALLGAVLAAVAFGAAGGFTLDRLTWAEIGTVLASGLLIAVAVMRARQGGRLNGGITLAAFAGLAALVAVSVAWSIAPDNSWLEANLTITYVFTFAAAAALARIAPDGWAIVLRGILIAAGAVVAYGLATRVWPSLDANDIFARLGAPYSYWNALGGTAALAVPPALWLGSRRSGHAPVNALAYPLLSLCWVAIFLSYSRAAVIVAAIGALLWVAYVPLRLRSLTLLGVSLGGAAPIVVWALGKDAFTKNGLPLAIRESVATEFGLFLLATIVVTLGVGLAIGFGIARRPPRATIRLRVGLAAALVACAVPIALFVVLATSDRGFTGTIQNGYESLTSTTRKTSGGPGRLLSASSSRGLYWHQARRVFDSHYWKGTGAGTFGVARLRFRASTDQSVSQHAHGYVQQTAADLGIAGLAVSVVLLVAWLIAAARAVGSVPRRRRSRLPWGPDRVGLVALALAAIVYGLHSAVDWIWFVPGPTVMAVVAAGFVAGRGPLALFAREETPATPVAAALSVRTPAMAMAAGAGGGVATAGAGGGVATAPPPPPPPALAPASAPPGSGSNGRSDNVVERLGASGPNGADPEAPTEILAPPPPPPPPPPAAPTAGPRLPALPRRIRRVARPALALLAIAATLLCAYAIWQPLRSDRQSDHALDLAAAGKTQAALAAVKRAHDYDPLTPRPGITRASILDGAGRTQDAKRALEDTVKSFPGDPQVWVQLAQYELNTLNRPADALAIIRGALFLDPQSRAAQTVFLQANALLHPAPLAPAVAPAPAPTPGP